MPVLILGAVLLTAVLAINGLVSGLIAFLPAIIVTLGAAFSDHALGEG